MSTAASELEFGILGSLEVLRGGEPLALGGAKQRALLVRLLLQPGEVVPVDRLIEDLWGADAPRTAGHTVQVYVSALRKALGSGAIRREGGGYVVDVEQGRLDAASFAALVARARGEEPSRAARSLREALALWRGPALADVRYESFAQTAIAQLEEQRLGALEERLEAELDSGAGPELVPELQALVTDHPLRERVRRQLMVALYRTGRQAEALQAYQDARIALLEDLGIDPSAELQELYRAILNHDESLNAVPRKPPSNLPAPPNALIGRERELHEVLELLRSSRLLTLTGAGGSGKTRLAVAAAEEVADEFPDGVIFVSLGALADPELVEATVASIVGARDDLMEFLGKRRLLLVLDNLEQLLPKAAAVVAAFVEAPHVKVLATSRERLAVSAEQEYPVPTLPLPEAVELFVRRARQLKPAFEPDEHVDEIARRLDGLPLALELAAARVKVLAPRQILERLSHSLELLTSGARDLPERQHTLRATIDWSYDLLGGEEQRLFAQLAVFAGSFDLGAAVAVVDADVELLQALVDKSLLRQTDEGRFVMLETIREFASERLGSGRSAAEIRERHAFHFVALAERLDAASRTKDHTDSYHELDLEMANVRAALGWTRDSERSDLLLRFATALWRFWSVRGYVAEGKAALEEALAATEDRHAQALLGLCTLRLLSGATAAELMPDAEAAVEACELLGDDFSRAQAWNLIGKLRGSLLAQLGPAERAFEQALVYAERGNHHTERAESIWGLMLSALAGPMPVPAALVRVDELLRLSDEPETRAFCLSARGALEAMAGEFDVARGLLAEGTEIFEQLGLNVWAANNAQLSFVVEMLGGDPEAAAQALRTSFERLAEMGEQGFLSTIAGYLAHALHETGDDEGAERFSRASESAAAADDVFSQILWRTARAKILAKRGEIPRAEALAREAVDLAEETDLLNAQGDALLDLADVLVVADRRREACMNVEEAARRFATKRNAVSLERTTELAAALTAAVD